MLSWQRTKRFELLLLQQLESTASIYRVKYQFLLLTGLEQKFDNIQLIPAADGFDAHSAQKDRCHLPNIKAATGLQYADMLFFDDENGNYEKVRLLAACMGA